MDKKNKKNFEYDENIKKFFKEKNKNLDDIIDDFILDDDEEIMNNVIQMSLENKTNNNLNNNFQNKVNNNTQNKINNNIQNKINNNIQNTINNENDLDYYSIPSIQIALEYGFSLDDAIMAYSIYGNNQELILDYLYSMKE
jgi:hypothetical protein